MKRTIKYYRIIWLKHDLSAGLSVFLVALPLCLGIALASGAPLYAGLLSGIIGGLVVALISGSQLAVSGPAAGLTTLVAASIISLGDYKMFLLAVMVAGLFQIILGLLKLGAIANYFPSSVIKGMLAAIGIILISKQIPLALGYDQPDFWTSGFLQLFSSGHFLGTFENFNHHITKGAILITAISITVLVLLQSRYIGTKKLKVIPATLLVVVIGIITNILFTNAASGFSLKQTQLVNVPSNIFASISIPDFSKIFSTTEIWKDGLIIGLLATLETLLCIEAVDKLDKRNRITPVNRELIAQGIGNMTCGLLGAIPITAVVVRGSAKCRCRWTNKTVGHYSWSFSFACCVICSFFVEQNTLRFTCFNSSYYRLQSDKSKTLSQYVETGMETILTFFNHHHCYSFDRLTYWGKHRAFNFHLLCCSK